MSTPAKYGLWLALGTLWCTMAYVLPDFADNAIGGLRGWLTMVVYVGAVGIVSGLILLLISVSRWLTAILLPLYMGIGAVVSYYRVAYHATVTPMVIEATLHTNMGTVSTMTSGWLIVWVIVNIAVAITLSIYRWRALPLRGGWFISVTACALLIVYTTCNDRLSNSLHQRYPLHIIHSIEGYAAQRHAATLTRETMPYHNEHIADSLDMVVILGEALRADHLGLNGYERQTTPRLSERRHLYSFSQLYSEYTYTAASVPHILTPADSAHTDRTYTHHSFIRILRDNGFRSVWLSNQDMSTSYAPFIHEADTIIFPHKEKSVFVFSPWYDETLVNELAQDRTTHDGARRLWVLHTIGSHWYYNNHVPESEQHYQPVTTERVITLNTPEQIINSYDNTARYMDLIVDSIATLMEDRIAAIVYVSDHGEALGEDGQWLHAGEVDGMHRPACLIWLSDKYAARYPERAAAIEQLSDKPCRTDIIYPLVLRLSGIESE